MRATYKYLAFAVAGLVALQAAFMVFAIAGLEKWVSDGHSLTEATMEAEKPPEFLGSIGFMLHGMNGMMLIPLIALALLIVSFFAKIPGGSKWAGFVLLAVVVQVALGLFGHEFPLIGFLHGINALILFSVATMAGRRAASEPVAVAAYEDTAVR